ncbi:AraC family transcriptional regulator [Hymenobacter sp. BT664]|uniref:AraC family transcriptional regulator n=1 Tax=Hymenobacter montanus TaxID=2771359 RepID=A0A927BDS7_9BACT|nr:helix-turn-helix domain-containing protein [Hymenobacter montanus]MBD2768197.1 AraC family transcriptional regulator [Hymenobacter montanus]
MEHIYNNLQDFFRSMGLPLQQDTELTVHPLDGLHSDQPIEAPLFRTNYYSFLLIRSGKSTYAINGHVFDLGPYSFYFTNPGHLKSFKIEVPLEGYMLTFSEMFIRQYFTSDFYQHFPFLIHETTPVMRLEQGDFAGLEVLFQQMEQEYLSHSPYRNPILANYLYILLYKTKSLLVTYQALTIKTQNRGAEIARDFKGLLKANFRSLYEGKASKVLSIKEYADALHMHPNYLSTVVKAETGKSPTDWIQERTLAEAQTLLTNSTKTITEITFQLGFSDTSHFAKFFKRHAGQSPAAYRKATAL